jgi:hypothetical protein
MDIRPATMAQVTFARDGRKVTIEEDVGSIAMQLKEIDPKLKLQLNEKGGFFMVIEDDGREERLVFTAQECDGRILKRMREIAAPDYDYVGELERMDKQAAKDRDHSLSEKSGEIGEHLAHALRKDLNPGKAVVSKDI